MPSLVDKIVAIADALERAAVAYAFGGALALAYATAEPRGTRDVDINIFATAADAASVFAHLPDAVAWSSDDVAAATDRDQVRLWWDDTPVDVFFAASDFHFEIGRRIRRVPFQRREIAILAAEDLAVFKVLFDRSKDWVDIETMLDSGGLDLDAVMVRVESLLGPDARIERARALRR